MLALERRNLILTKLQEEKRVVVSELSQRLSNASINLPPFSFFVVDYKILSIILLSGCAMTEESRYIPFSATSSFALWIDASTAETSPVIII